MKISFDGNTIELPDDATEDEVKSVLAQQGKAKTQESVYEKYTPDIVKSELKASGEILKTIGETGQEVYSNLGRGMENTLVGQAQYLTPEEADVQKSLAERAKANNTAIEKSGFLKGTLPAMAGEMGVYATELAAAPLAIPAWLASAYGGTKLATKLAPIAQKAASLLSTEKKVGGGAEFAARTAKSAIKATPAGYIASEIAPTTGLTEQERTLQREARPSGEMALVTGAMGAMGPAVRELGDWVSLSSLEKKLPNFIKKPLGISAERGNIVATDRLNKEFGDLVDKENMLRSKAGEPLLDKTDMASNIDKSLAQLTQLKSVYGADITALSDDLAKNTHLAAFLGSYYGKLTNAARILGAEGNEKQLAKIITKSAAGDSDALVASRMAGLRAKEASIASVKLGNESIKAAEKEKNSLYEVANKQMTGETVPDSVVYDAVDATAKSNKGFAKEILNATPSGLKRAAMPTKKGAVLDQFGNPASGGSTFSFNDIREIRDDINKQVNSAFLNGNEADGARLGTIRDTLDGLMDNMITKKGGNVVADYDKAKAFYKDIYLPKVFGPISGGTKATEVASKAAGPLMATSTKKQFVEPKYLDKIVGDSRGVDDFIRLNGEDNVPLLEQHLLGKLANTDVGSSGQTALEKFRTTYGNTLSNPAMSSLNKQLDDLETAVEAQWTKINEVPTYLQDKDMTSTLGESLAIGSGSVAAPLATRAGAFARFVSKERMGDITDQLMRDPELTKKFLLMQKGITRNKFTDFYNSVINKYATLMGAAQSNVQDTTTGSTTTYDTIDSLQGEPTKTDQKSIDTIDDLLGSDSQSTIIPEYIPDTMSGTSAGKGLGAGSPTKIDIPNPAAQPTEINMDTRPTSVEEHASLAAQAAEKVGVDPNLGILFAALESSIGQAAPDNPMQVMSGTWQDLVKQYGARHGITTGDRNSPAANYLMGMEYLNDMYTSVKGTVGRTPEPYETYMAYAMGAEGFKTFNSIRKSGDKLVSVASKLKALPDRKYFYEGNKALNYEQVEQKFRTQVLNKTKEAKPYMV